MNTVPSLESHGREEALFLCAISRAGSVDEPADAPLSTAVMALVDGSFRWERFVGFARRHACLAAAYRFVADTGADSRVPAALLQEMKLGYALAQATYIKNLIELRELAEGLRRDGIPAIVMKGIPLAARIYTEPSIRVSKDIDLLCGIDDLQRVESLLEEMGYTLHQGRLGADRYRRHHYHLVYSRGTASESVVEVHWNIRQPAKGVRVDTEPLFRHSIPVEVAGTNVDTLDDRHALWQLAVNLSYSGFLDARDLGDLRRLARRLGDEEWENLGELSRRTGTFNEFSTALAVAERTFGRFVPDARRPAVRPRVGVRTMFLPAYSPRAVAWRWLPFGGAQRLSVNLFMRQGIGRKLRYLYHIVIPDGASLIETRAARPAPNRLRDRLSLCTEGAWIAFKVVAVATLLGPMAKTGFMANGWADPERHIDLANPPRGSDSSRFPLQSR